MAIYCAGCGVVYCGAIMPKREEAVVAAWQAWNTRHSPVATILSAARDRFGRVGGRPPGKSRKGRVDRTIDRFFHCRMKTDDDWAPNLESADGTPDEVDVTILGWGWEYEEGKVAYRVCVWGGDDFGYERDYKFEETNPTELVKFVLSWPSVVNRSWLELQGFYPA